MQISMLTHSEAETEAEQRGRTLSVRLMNGRTEACPGSTQSEPRPSVSDLAQQQNLGRDTLQAKISILRVSDQRRKNAIRDQVTTEKPKGGKALPGGGRCAGEFCPLIPRRPGHGVHSTSSSMEPCQNRTVCCVMRTSASASAHGTSRKNINSSPRE